MPYSTHSILTSSTGTLHTVGWLQKLVHHQAIEYLASHPYGLNRNTWLARQLTRLQQPPTKGETKDKIGTCPEILHEELLLDISENLIYRRTVIRQATGYKNEILPDFPDCQNLDLEWSLGFVCRPPKPDPDLSLKERQKRVTTYLKTVQILNRNTRLIATANLFAQPGTDQERHREEKPIIYLALVMAFTENTAAVTKKPTTAQKQIEVLKAAKHRVCQPNVREPETLLSKYGGPMKVNFGADGKPFLQQNPLMGDGSLTPRPRR